ncbi:uncharacterized protein LOC113228171 [Hyposmocoma kahamanoa]|uniref:uncharacterized protein LOC113228171 n=1 Tax=Hyposmocoma kahamanoa TaxID=1477025 RepID=UPI000E6D9851|nr:uncharacterized protein LOC113228171 [Hyposmocoma kahamanoa]
MSRVNRCLVDGCSSTSETANLCRWSRSVDLERVWIDLLKSHSSRLASSLTHRNCIQRNAYVCKLHFEDKFIKDDKRVPFSWPTLFSEVEIACRKPTCPVTVSVRTVGDHTYAVLLQINAELVTRKRKRTSEHRPHTQYSTY